ncbi:hypothetical protein ACQ4M3_36575 [Leptolyngbya sp. AN03gr2]|uniref:hypothetical protein n=1 Tax=unclassified Leptolyngbya TaxID=2650499 RepID=UPI003D314C9D
MKINVKQVPMLLSCVVAVLIVGKLIYDRIAPAPMSQELNESADRINSKLDAIKKAK